jgi:hypothetical protein
MGVHILEYVQRGRRAKPAAARGTRRRIRCHPAIGKPKRILAAVMLILLHLPEEALLDPLRFPVAQDLDDVPVAGKRRFSRFLACWFSVGDPEGSE